MTKEDVIFDYVKKQSKILLLSTVFTILCAGSFGAYIGYVNSITTMLKFGLMQIVFISLYEFTHGYFFNEMQAEVDILYGKVKEEDDLK